MNDELLEMRLKFYGISPWEIEVIYGYLNPRFTVVEEEIEQDDEDYVNMLDFEIPLPFNVEFFQWFDFRRWENLKSLFKEMKRRRGEKHTFKIQINFFEPVLIHLNLIHKYPTGSKFFLSVTSRNIITALNFYILCRSCFEMNFKVNSFFKTFSTFRVRT